MFLKSIKHVHKLSPSGRERERESEHMWGLYNYCFLVGKNARVTKCYQIEEENAERLLFKFSI